MISSKLLKIKNHLIVSCQAEEGSPFNSPDAVTMFAIAAQQGGAGGIRSEGIEKTAKIKQLVDLPIIALVKNKYPDGYVRITRGLSEVEALIKLDVEFIAIDGTFRVADSFDGPGLIKYCKINFPHQCIIADISTLEDANACIESGADAISTTLRGYTPLTSFQLNEPADINFIKELLNMFPDCPVIAEGKINSPEMTKQIAKLGVWSIVIGSAITRPQLITKEYVNSMKFIIK